MSSFLKGLAIVSLISGCIAVLGNFLLLGIPGALIFSFSLKLFQLSESDIKSDSAWPIAILITFLWPISIIAAYIITFKTLRSITFLLKLTVMFGMTVIWGVILSLILYKLGHK